VAAVSLVREEGRGVVVFGETLLLQLYLEQQPDYYIIIESLLFSINKVKLKVYLCAGRLSYLSIFYMLLNDSDLFYSIPVFFRIEEVTGSFN